MQVSDIIDFTLTRKGLWIVYNSCEGEKEIDLNPEETVHLLKGAEYIKDYSLQDGLLIVTTGYEFCFIGRYRAISFGWNEFVLTCSMNEAQAAELVWCHERLINNKAA